MEGLGRDVHLEADVAPDLRLLPDHADRPPHDPLVDRRQEACPACRAEERLRQDQLAVGPDHPQQELVLGDLPRVEIDVRRRDRRIGQVG